MSSAFGKEKNRETLLRPFACSLADHIAPEEAGVSFVRETVDLGTKQTVSGKDFFAVSAKGYVPALVLEGRALVKAHVVSGAAIRR